MRSVEELIKLDDSISVSPEEMASVVEAYIEKKRARRVKIDLNLGIPINHPMSRMVYAGEVQKLMHAYTIAKYAMN